jgi:hypothetical protein
MQAIRKYMIEKLYFDRETVSTFMEEVVILTLIPIAEVQIYGVPYLSQIFEPDGLDEREVARWEKFWAYFERQWLKTVDPHSWNVHDTTDDVKDFINRTNNPIESYNSQFNGKFHTSGWSIPFLEFVQITKDEALDWEQQYDDVRKFRRARKNQDEWVFPELPQAFIDFRENYND